MQTPCKHRHPRRTARYCIARLDHIQKFGLTSELARRCSLKSLGMLNFKIANPKKTNVVLAEELQISFKAFEGHIEKVDKHIDDLIGSEQSRRIMHEGEGEPAASKTATGLQKTEPGTPEIDAAELLQLTAEKLAEKLLSKMFFKL